MSKKTLLIIAIVIIGLAFAATYWKQNSKPKKDARIGQFIAKVYGEDFDRLSLQSFDQQVRLEKKAGVWEVQDKLNFPANQEKLLALLENLNQYRVASLVSLNAKKHEVLQVKQQGEQGSTAENTGTTLRLEKEGKVVVEVIFAKPYSPAENASKKRRSNAAYLRYAGEDKVYAMKEDFKLSTESSDWLETKIINISKDKVKQIHYEFGKERFTLSKEKEGQNFKFQNLEEGEVVKESEIESFLTAALSLHLSDVISTSKVEERQGFIGAAQIKIELFDQTTIDLWLGKDKIEEENETHYVKVEVKAGTEASEQWKILEFQNQRGVSLVHHWKLESLLISRNKLIGKKES